MLNILDIIYQLESSSGKNKKAYKENSVGALGGYQITRRAFKDLQTRSPEKWAKHKFEQVAMTDTLSRVAADDYLKQIEQYLVKNKVAPTTMALLAGYHSGMGNVVKGKLGPEGMKYLTRAKELMGTTGVEE